MNREIIMVNISELKPHPENEKIYGTDDDVQSLQKSILENGLRNHIKINENNIIISGHRRWQAFKNLVAEGHKEFNEIPCQVLHFENEEDELECLVIENDTSSQRHKTIEQETRELMVYKEIEAIRAKKRMSLGGKGGIDKGNEGTPNSADVVKGETREILFQKYGDKYNLKSSHDVDRRIKSVEKADKLRKNGESEKSELIISLLNTVKISQAYDLSNAIDEMTNETIRLITDGKTTVRKAIQEFKGNKFERKPVSNAKYVSQKEQTEAIKDLFYSEINSSKIRADVLISHLNEINRMCSESSLFPYYPEELINTIKSTISTLSRNMKYINQINEMGNIPLIKEFDPIIKLEFWKKIKYFNKKGNKVYTLTDDIVFTILQSLALITDETGYWLFEDDDGNYWGYDYNINHQMLNFAKSFYLQDKEIISNLVNLYKQFDKVINSLNSKEMDFFNKCNLPHIINVLNYFNSLERDDVEFTNLLTDFLKSPSKKDYENCAEYDSAEYTNDLTYAEPNVEARIDFLKEYVDDYIDNIDEEMDDNDE